MSPSVTSVHFLPRAYMWSQFFTGITLGAKRLVSLTTLSKNLLKSAEKFYMQSIHFCGEASQCVYKIIKSTFLIGLLDIATQPSQRGISTLNFGLWFKNSERSLMLTLLTILKLLLSLPITILKLS